MPFHPRLAPVLTREPEARVGLPTVLSAIGGSQWALGRCCDHRTGRSDPTGRGRRLIGWHPFRCRRRDRIEVRTVTRGGRGRHRAWFNSGAGCQSGARDDSGGRNGRSRGAGRSLAGREERKTQAERERESGACHPARHENLLGGSGREPTVARAIPGRTGGKKTPFRPPRQEGLSGAKLRAGSGCG